MLYEDSSNISRQAVRKKTETLVKDFGQKYSSGEEKDGDPKNDIKERKRTKQPQNREWKIRILMPFITQNYWTCVIKRTPYSHENYYCRSIMVVD